MDRDQTPRRWLFTDPRLGPGTGGVVDDGLERALAALAPGDGVMLRHDALAPGDRQRLGDAIARRAASRGLVLGVSRDAALAEALGAAVLHNPPREPAATAVAARAISRSVHDEDEARAAADAAIWFISPVFATRSHPGADALGIARARALASRCPGAAIALGGMDDARFAALGAPFHGWAGIDAFGG